MVIVIVPTSQGCMKDWEKVVQVLTTDPRAQGEPWPHRSFLNNEHSSDKGGGTPQRMIQGNELTCHPWYWVPGPCCVATQLCYAHLESVLDKAGPQVCVLPLSLRIEGAWASGSQKHGTGEWLSKGTHSRCFQTDFITRLCLRFKLGNHRSILQIVKPIITKLMRQIPNQMTQVPLKMPTTDTSGALCSVSFSRQGTNHWRELCL